MVPCQIQGERDDRNNWDGGTPGWEEFTTGACDVCGDDWTTEEEEQLRDNYRPYEPEVDE
jgi:hypothetical protein